MKIIEEIIREDTKIKCNKIANYTLSNKKNLNISVTEINIYDNLIQWKNKIGDVCVYYNKIKKIKLSKAKLFQGKIYIAINIIVDDGFTPSILIYYGLNRFSENYKLGRKICRTFIDSYNKYINEIKLKEDELIRIRHDQMKESVLNYKQDHLFYKKFKKKLKMDFDDFMSSLCCLGNCADEVPDYFQPGELKNRKTKTMYYNDKYFILGDSHLITLYKDSKIEINDNFKSRLDTICKDFDYYIKNIYSLDLIKYIDTIYANKTFVGSAPSNLDLLVTANVLGTTAAYIEATKSREKTVTVRIFHIIFEEQYDGPEVYFNLASQEIKINSEELKLVRKFIEEYPESTYIQKLRQKTFKL